MAKRASLKSSNQETWGESSSRETCPRQVLGETTHATRDSVAKTPYFPKTISCQALIMGETGDSGQNPGPDGDGKMATIPNEFRESSWRCPRIEIRADNGGFYEPDSSPQPLLRREVESLRPPLERFLAV